MITNNIKGNEIFHLMYLGCWYPALKVRHFLLLLMFQITIPTVSHVTIAFLPFTEFAGITLIYWKYSTTLVKYIGGKKTKTVLPEFPHMRVFI